MKNTAISALLVSAVLICGCDFLRGLAGRPSSGEINEKRVLVEAARADAAAREKARADSLSAIEKNVADSLSAIARLDALNVRLRSLSETGSVCGGLRPGYFIVVGSFKSAVNAERMARRVSDAGYDAATLKFSNGMTAVAVEPRTKIADALDVYEKVRNEKFCPEDVWILRNDPIITNAEPEENE